LLTRETELSNCYSAKTENFGQNPWVSGLCPSSGILNSRKHNVSGTESVSVFRWRGETPTLLGPL
jgi:hypothetical protein